MTGVQTCALPILTVDHINCDGLDNRRINLRPATIQQQRINRKCYRNKKHAIGIKGVSKDHNVFRARISFNKITYFLGNFKTEKEAHKAYIKKAKELHGEFAKWK